MCGANTGERGGKRKGSEEGYDAAGKQRLVGNQVTPRGVEMTVTCGGGGGGRTGADALTGSLLRPAVFRCSVLQLKHRIHMLAHVWSSDTRVCGGSF